MPIWSDFAHVVTLLLYLAKQSNSLQNNISFRLVSWNILAPIYAEPDKYIFTEPAHLKWSYRKPRIIARLLEAEPDIIFLQEVQVDLFQDLISDLPQYCGTLQNVTRQHQVAVATLIKRDMGCVVASESRSRALITVLKLDNGHLLLLGNVHLDAGFKEQKTRYNQLRSLLHRLNNQARKLSIHDPPVLIAGDFNMLAKSELYELLSRGVLPTARIRLTDRALDTLPLLPLHDAYRSNAQLPLRQNLTKTYAGGSVLDYIWTTRNIRVAEAWPMHPGPVRRGPSVWPSNRHPSDHAPIGGVFSLVPKN